MQGRPHIPLISHRIQVCCPGGGTDVGIDLDLFALGGGRGDFGIDIDIFALLGSGTDVGVGIVTLQGWWCGCFFYQYRELSRQLMTELRNVTVKADISV